MPTPAGIAQDATLNNRWKAVTGSPSAIATTTADQIIYTPASGKHTRLKWFYAATPQDSGSTSCVVTVKLGTVQIYQFPLGSPGIFAHGSIRESLNADDKITVTLSVARIVYFNLDCEDF